MADKQPADTFLSLDCASKALVWVNGVNLGWAWPAAGPQHTLYVPGPLLRPGGNDLLVLEFVGMQPDCAGAHTLLCELPSGCTIV